MATQDKLVLVLKGILLYTTFIVCIFSIMGIDSIYDKGYFFIDIALCTALINTCYKSINKEEFNILTLKNYFVENQEYDDEL